MPKFSRVVDTEGVALLESWIRELAECPEAP
jgi:hypothetical protein